MSGFTNWNHELGRGIVKIGKLIDKDSNVYRGVFDRKEVAVKSVLDTNEKECAILCNLSHENIIKYMYMEQEGRTLHIVLELCSYSLKQYVLQEDHCNISLTPIEVLKQITEGVYYLHTGQTFCTVHRDLKPSNVLFLYVKRDAKWVVKISDFGLSKDLSPDKSSTTSYVKGSPGYIAPELLAFSDGTKGHGEIRKETDMFSLGVIFYFTLSGGKHPFSNDPYAVNAKVRDYELSLCELGGEYKLAESLILSLISKDWKERIKIQDVKSHFIFWDWSKTLNFFQTASDFLEDRNKHQKLINAFNKKCKDITGGDWFEKLCSEPEKPKVCETLQRRRKKTSLQDLLRQIRNCGHHYNDKTTSDELRKELGDFPDGFIQYFTSRFPKLLPHTYAVLSEKKDELVLKDFYGIKVEDAVTYAEGAQAFGSTVPMPNDEEDDDNELLSMDGDSSFSANQASESTLILRNYQKELAEQALAGHNSLIIAPTGSGKTAVANEIIKHHLKEENSKSVLFFVSKTTLALQRFYYFKKYLQDLSEREIVYLLGVNTANCPIGANMKKAKLTVLTPQILINELGRKKSFISFNDISLMIFDECHNATGRHPYKIIMEMLYDFQIKNENPPIIQVVGMTASPDVGKGKTREKVFDNLIGLLANLNITQCPSIVERNTEELKQHQNEIDESYIKVPIEDDLFTKKILKAIQLIENQIREEGVIGSGKNQVEEPPVDKTKQKYEQWTVQLIHHVQLKIYEPDSTGQSGKARTVVTYAEHLRMYYNLLYYKKLIMHAMEVTNDFASFNQDSEQGRFLRQINKELLKAEKYAKVPMLDKLFLVLEDQFKRKPDSHCIIFVPQKKIASSLVDCIKNHDKLTNLEPVFLTESNRLSLTEQMTKTKQSSALNTFEIQNNCKVLIATSVSEEGLVIRACNLVIMYNYVTGEVGRIQRAGHVSAENSRFVLIVPNGSQLVQGKINAYGEEATNVAIEDLKKFTTYDRTRKISKIQRREHKERMSNTTPVKKQLEEAAKWRILCSKCQAFLTNADQLRRINSQHVLVIDPTFKERVSRRHFSGEPGEIGPGVFGVQFVCPDLKCRSYVGLEMLHKNQSFPTLTVKQLIFEDRLGGRKITKQWSKCPFKIEEMEETEADEIEKTVVEEQVEKFFDEQNVKLPNGKKELEGSNYSPSDAAEITYGEMA
ncbi:antiviral innate immune response receptor RIG-I-like isoform X2 [Styela clava]